jgi:disulfide bond formation protein DsbB
MRDPGLNFLALAYRIVFTIFGGYLTARFAPRNPMRHVFVLATIGLVMGVAGVVATSGLDLGPRWYPIALAVTAFPCTWLGGILRRTPRAE